MAKGDILKRFDQTIREAANPTAVVPQPTVKTDFATLKRRAVLKGTRLNAAKILGLKR